MSKEDAPPERYRLICEHWEIPAGTIFDWHEDGFLVYQADPDAEPLLLDIREIEAPDCFEPVTAEGDVIDLWREIDRPVDASDG